MPKQQTVGAVLLKVREIFVRVAASQIRNLIPLKHPKLTRKGRGSPGMQGSHHLITLLRTLLKTPKVKIISLKIRGSVHTLHLLVKSGVPVTPRRAPDFMNYSQIFVV